VLSLLLTIHLHANAGDDSPYWNDAEKVIEISLEAIRKKYPEYSDKSLEIVVAPQLFCEGTSPFTLTQECFISVSVFATEGSIIYQSKDRNDKCIENIDHKIGFIVELNVKAESIVNLGYGTYYRSCKSQFKGGA